MVDDPRGADRRPILVTGVPRSGTTWLARWLAGGGGTALAGREPMNPRQGQYALAGTLTGWARVTRPTPRQRLALRTAYRGLNPMVYSKYGARQWSAPLPRTRLVVKDPFALLSLPAIVSTTRALPVLVYRHPGAVLASYRRMGWAPDTEELRAVLAPLGPGWSAQLPSTTRTGALGEAEAMARFWAVLHDLALTDVEATGTEVVVVAHHEVASAGTAAGRRFAARVGVAWTDEMEQELTRESAKGQAGAGRAGGPLHDFERSPAQVAQAWRSALSDAELELVEAVTERTRQRVEAKRFRLSGSP